MSTHLRQGRCKHLFGDADVLQYQVLSDTDCALELTGDMFYGQDHLELVERALVKPFPGSWPR